MKIVRSEHMTNTVYEKCNKCKDFQNLQKNYANFMEMFDIAYPINTLAWTLIQKVLVTEKFTISCEKPTPLGVGWIAGNKNLSSIAI